MIDKQQIIQLLENIADILEFRGENSFKVNAYRMGAVAIRKIDENINEIITRKELHKIKGIGKGLQSVIYEFSELGHSTLEEEISKDIPGGVRDLMKISGIGPRKISYLYQQLNISTIDDLEKAAEDNRIAPVKGFGESLQDKILEEIKRVRMSAGYVLLNEAFEIGEEISQKLKRLSSVISTEYTGTLRRRLETINVVEIIAKVKSKSEFHKEINTLLNSEDKDGYYFIKDGYIPLIKVYPSTNTEHIYNQFILTGAEDFLKKLPDIKKKKYLSEQDIFKQASFPYVIPEMREKEYFLYSQPGNSNLEDKDIVGLLHFHTTYSDGRNSLADMLGAAEKKGYKYAMVCDHSKSAYYANGLNEDRILLQNKEISRLNNKSGITIWQGIESDILKDGSLDYPVEIISQFQFVMASVHSRFNLDSTEMTQRMIKAIENEYTDAIGHISGRLLLMRESYKMDMIKVLDACAANGVAIEINSNPRRLDIDWRLIFPALERGCKFTINSDAHSVRELDLIKYGIMMGRKSGLMKEDVINCYDKEKFIKFLNKKRQRIAG